MAVECLLVQHLEPFTEFILEVVIVRQRETDLSVILPESGQNTDPWSYFAVCDRPPFGTSNHDRENSKKRT